MTSFQNNANDNDTNYILYLFVPTDNEMRQTYVEKVEAHNQDLTLNSHMDSGFDVYVEKSQSMECHKVNKVNFNIKCEMLKKGNNGNWEPSAFYMYPRSSISKTKFRLANSVGIIDSGYRGNLMGMFDVIYSLENVQCERGTRLCQICTSTLEPFKIVLIESDSNLSVTRRNDGGFGSTGGVASIY